MILDFRLPLLDYGEKQMQRKFRIRIGFSDNRKSKIQNRKSVGLLAIIVALTVCGARAEAQQAKKVWRIGLFHVGLDHVPPSLEPLRQELKKLGYEEGKNIQLDWRNLPDEDAANATAKEFVLNRVDLIVAFENQTARATKAATSEIPVVLVHGEDAVAEGFGKSMSHPGGNMTGFLGVGDVPGKRIELFKDVVPRLRRLLVLADPKDPAAERSLAELRAAAKSLKVLLVERGATTQADVERVFGSLKQGDVDGIFVLSQSLNLKFSSLMVRLSSEKRLPFVGYRREWVEQGALFSYAHDLASVGPPAARYIDRILKGAKPADLPFQEASHFDFVINLKTAKQIGVTIPPNVLARADKVIK
jgi:putative ABC transport system substrate-binding protein